MKGTVSGLPTELTRNLPLYRTRDGSLVRINKQSTFIVNCKAEVKLMPVSKGKCQDLFLLRNERKKSKYLFLKVVESQFYQQK